MKGLTLIELMLGMAIFASVIVLVTAMFSGSLLSQRQISAAKHVHEEARYIMEFIQKEARLAQYDVTGDCAGLNQIYLVSLDLKTLNFRDTEGYCTTYEFSGTNLRRSTTNKSRGFNRLNSYDVKITNGFFNLSGKLLSYQFNVSDINDKININIMSSASARAYK